MGLLDQWEALKGYIQANTPRNTRAPVSHAQVIDQGLLGGRIANIPQRAQEIKRGLLNIPQDLAQLTSPEVSQAVQAAMAGKGNQVNPQQWIDAGLELSGMAPVTAFGGMFIGKGAKTWDVLKAKQAEEMLAKGIDPREVWKQTGTLKGVDGAWRQEIPDNISPTKMDATVENLFFYPKAHEYINHKPLFDAYPDTQMITMANGNIGKEGGAYLPDQNVIQLDAPYFNNKTLETNQRSHSTALHELQHAIQQREGWARGGSPSEFSVASPGDREVMMEPLRSEISSLARRKHEDATFGFSGFERGKPETMADPEIQGLLAKLKEIEMRFDPMAQYKLLAGEAEARATQARMGMDMKQRLETYPFDSYDVPVDKMIVRGLLGE